tara:strand:+ start:14318 stop:18751 length:4434 start_codon:yes stop_codon:yes gene_type:complete
MRDILICCLLVVVALFLIPSAFAADADNSDNFNINIKTLDDTATITEIAIPKGNNKTIRIDLPKQNSAFNGTVTLEIEGNPTGLSTSFTSTAISGWQGTTGKNSTLTISPQLSALSGSYQITIKAINSNDATDYAQRTITLFISDFEITASPTTVSLRPGEQKDIDITISSKKDDVNNNIDTKFSGSVQLLPTSMSGATIVYVDDIINVPEGVSAHATARITIDSNAESNGDGVFVDVVAKIGDLQHTVTFKVKIESNPLSIGLAISPNPAIVFQPTVITATVTDAAGNPVDSALVTFNRLGGNGTFADGATFTTLTTGSNGKVSATFTPKSKETLSIRVSAEKTNYVSGELTTQIPVKGDFVMSITPTQEQINAGDSKAVTLTITSTDGFSSPVELSYEDVVVGFTVSFSESNIIPEANGATSTTITIFVDDNVQSGIETIIIKGKSGGIAHDVSIGIEVPKAEFTLAISETQKEIITWQGDIVKIDMVLTSIGGFDGTVQLSTSIDDMANIELEFSSSSVSLSSGESKQISLIVTTTSATSPMDRMPIVIKGTSLTSEATTTAWLQILQLFEVVIDSTDRDDGSRISTIIINDKSIQPEQLPYVEKMKEGSILTLKIAYEIIEEEEGTRYVFRSWNDQSENIERTITIEGPSAFIAQFDKEHYINIRSKPVSSMIGLLDIKGSGWHKANSLVEIETNEVLMVTEGQSRYRFDKWSGSIASDQREIEILVNGPKLIYADYILQYKITRIIEPSFIADIISTFEEPWIDSGSELLLETTKKADEYGFMQWTITGNNFDLTRTANPTTIIVNEPLTIRIQYDLLPIVSIESIRMPNTGFEGEGSQIWIKLSNTELRGGYIIVKTSTDIKGLIIEPDQKEFYLAPGESKLFAITMNYTKAGSGSVEITLEKTGSQDNSIKKNFNIFTLKDKRDITNIGIALSSKNLQQIDQWMIPDERVKICSSEILEQARISDDESELQKAKSILRFVSDKIEPSSAIPNNAGVIIEEFGIIGCINTEDKINGDSRTYQILMGSLLRSLDIQVRPVIGVMGISGDNEKPSALMNTWIEAELDGQWVVIDSINNIIETEIDRPFNGEDEISYRQRYSTIPENGGILTAMIYDCITICNLDVSNEYRGTESPSKLGSVLFVTGDVEIEVRDSNENFIANGTLIHYKWFDNGGINNNIPTKLILLSEGVDLEYIIMRINGELGEEFEINGMKIINFEPQTKSIKSGLISKTISDFKLVSLGDELIIAEFDIIVFDNREIEILSTASLVDYTEQKRLNAIRLNTMSHSDNEELVIIKFSDEILTDIDSKSDRIVVIINEVEIPIEITDDGVIITVLIDDLKNLDENVITLYFSSYSMNFELRDPLNQIIRNADITMIGEFTNRTQISNEGSFMRLIPGNYEFIVEYRGEQEIISERINDKNVDVEINLYRSDSMVIFFITIIFLVILAVAYGIEKAFTRILPEYKNKNGNSF